MASIHSGELSPSTPTLSLAFRPSALHAEAICTDCSAACWKEINSYGPATPLITVLRPRQGF